MIKNQSILLTSVSVIFGAAFVAFVKPFSGGIYANSFFEIPYPIAYLFVPVASGSITYISSMYIYKKYPDINSSYKANILITLLAFYLYGITHAITVAITNNYLFTPSIFFGFIIFGTLVILPVCILVVLLATYVTNEIKYSKK